MSNDFDAVKVEAGKFIKARKLKLTRDSGYEALLAFYAGWYRGELPPYVAICFSCGRHTELVA